MYQKLDYLIVEAIKGGCKAMQDIEKTDAGYEAGQIAARTERLAMRVMDGRLQALRKRGLIRHCALGWEAVE